jgi:hypothetical protein
MSQQTIVYGFIEVPRGQELSSAIRRSLESKEQPWGPLDVFSRPVPGYYSSMISFAGSYKDIHSHWLEWRSVFEDLLSKLVAISASVHVWHSDSSSRSFSVAYVASGDVSQERDDGEQAVRRSWSRLSYSEGQKLKTEETIWL